MRLFVALALPPDVRRPLAAWRVPLDGARWVPAAKLHLTLRFLGATDASTTDAITEQLAGLAGPPVPVQTGALLALPSARRPRVLAVRVEACDPLRHVHTAVERALAAAGIAPDPRPLLPHVTLARLRRPDVGAVRETVVAASPPEARGLATEVQLIESRLAPGGSVYTPRLHVALR